MHLLSQIIYLIFNFRNEKSMPNRQKTPHEREIESMRKYLCRNRTPNLENPLATMVNRMRARPDYHVQARNVVIGYK